MERWKTSLLRLISDPFSNQICIFLVAAGDPNQLLTLKNAKSALKIKVPSYQRKLPDWITNQEKHKVWFQTRGQAACTAVPSSRSPAEAPGLRVSRSHQPNFSKGTTYIITPTSGGTIISFKFRSTTFHSQEDLKAASLNLQYNRNSTPV